MSDNRRHYFDHRSLPTLTFYFQVMPNQAIRSTPHLESTVGPSSFLMGPRLLPPSHLRLLPLTNLPRLPLHQFSLAWFPLTTPMPPLPPLLHPHLSSKQDHRPPVVMPHLHPHLSLKPTHLLAPLVELLSLAVGASLLPPSMLFLDQAPLQTPAAAQTPCLRRTPWFQCSKSFFLSPQTTIQDPPSLAYSHTQVTPLGQ